MALRFILCIIYICLGALSSKAAASSELSLRHLNTASGFSNNFVTDLFKDSRGLLWIGTSSGLYRFDGYAARRIADLNGLSDEILTGYVYYIYEDALGRLWIHADTYFGLYDPLSDKSYRYASDYLNTLGIEGYVTSVITDERGDVWIAVDRQGLFRLCLPEGIIEKVKGDSFEGGTIVDLELTGDKIIGVTNRSVIVEADRQSMTSRTISKSPDVSEMEEMGYDLYIDKSKRLWLLTNERLHLFDLPSGRWLTDSLPGKGLDGVVKALFNDSNGNLWIARDHHGIERVVNNNGSFVYEPVKVNGGFNPSNTVTSIFEDEYGTLWFGTYKLGLYSYNESVEKFALEDFPDVNCMVAGKNDEIWVGTDNSGLWHWNLATGERKGIADPSEGEAPKAITSLAYSPDGKLYIGAFSRGIRSYQNGVFTPLVTGSDIDNHYAWSMAFDKNGLLWIGTLGGGLFVLNPLTGEVRKFDEQKDGLSSNYVLSVLPSRDGKVYIGSSGGIDCYNPSDGVLSRMDAGDKAKSENIKVVQLFEDSRGLLWVPTPNGLKVIDRLTNTWHDIPTGQSSRTSYIMGVTEDNGGAIWVSDGSRLVNIKVSYDEKTGELSTIDRVYDSRDGLQNCDFNQRSFAKLPNGDITVGGMFGINRFAPSEIRFNTAKPNVMFTDLYMGNFPVQVGEKIDGRVVLKRAIGSNEQIEFSHNPKEFTIFFASDDYALPEKTSFMYKLVGYSDEWMKCPEGINYVTYTNLSPGNYRLLVKAINGDGYESETAAELPIKVYPSFWGSSWAIMIYLVLFVAIVGGIVKVVRERERKLFEKKRHEDALRKQEEINQMKFRFFTNVSHDLRTPLTLIVSPLDEMIKESDDERQTKRLTLMRNNAVRLLSLVNQLLDFRKNEVAGLQLNPSEGDIVAFARSVCQSFVTLSDRKNIVQTFYSDRERIILMFDEDKMEKILMNLLGNAFKFTPAGGRIDVALEQVGDENPVLRIKVSDTGIGIKDKDKEHIFERFYQVDEQGDSHPGMGSGIGLSMVSEYVKLHDGTIRVTDNVGQGSVFIIDIPIRSTSSLSANKETLAEPGQNINAEEDANLGMETEKEDAKVYNDRKTVLVVDDNIDMTEMLKDSLIDDYDVLTAGDGNEALDAISQQTPDIILTDLMMPGMNGIELCRKLKSNKATVNIPLIIITAKHDLGVKLEGLTIGADDYITKPFNLDVLRLRMKRLVALTAKGAGRTLIDPEPEHIEITPLDEKLIEKAMKYVSDNLDRSDLSVEELSSALGMSRVRLYKKVKQITGKTPIEFIRVIRLKRAAQLLRESQLNVSEIAYQTGFNNPKVFSKYFKDEFGILPSVYQDKEGKETNYTV